MSESAVARYLCGAVTFRDEPTTAPFSGANRRTDDDNRRAAARCRFPDPAVHRGAALPLGRAIVGYDIGSRGGSEIFARSQGFSVSVAASIMLTVSWISIGIP